jgi:tetratricopeptide (TPR) repeat protein
MNFLDPGELSIVYQYRGEVYLGLHSTYTASQALQEFLHSLDLNPKNYWAMYDIANLYLNNLKDYSSAESYINQAIGLYPDYSYFYITRGDLYRAQGNLPGAILAYQDALTLQPGYQPFLDRLAAAQAALQKQSP